MIPVKSESLANIRELDGHTIAWEKRTASRIPKVGAGPRLTLPSDPTAIPVVII
jgi:hypothetical protein